MGVTVSVCSVSSPEIIGVGLFWSVVCCFTAVQQFVVLRKVVLALFLYA